MSYFLDFCIVRLSVDSIAGFNFFIVCSVESKSIWKFFEMIISLSNVCS